MKNFKRFASILSLALAFLFLATAPRCGTDKPSGQTSSTTSDSTTIGGREPGTVVDSIATTGHAHLTDDAGSTDAPQKLTMPTKTGADAYLPVEIRETENLRFFFPNFSKVDLVCGTMPDKRKDTDVILTCAAAYTAECLNKFEHSNIIGNHVSGGKLYAGAKSHSYRGAFAFYDGKAHFAHNDWTRELREAADKGGCLFAQDMMIHKGNTVKPWRNPKSTHVFRSICEVDGRLAIVDSKKEMVFEDYIQDMLRNGVTEAIYLDMGGWRHSWYRDSTMKAVDIFPAPNPYATNWITFYR